MNLVGKWAVVTSRTSRRYLGRVVEHPERPENRRGSTTCLDPCVELVLMPTATGGLREMASHQSGITGPYFVDTGDLVCVEQSHALRMLGAAGVEYVPEKNEETTHAGRHIN